jgi:hypothetical protein
MSQYERRLNVVCIHSLREESKLGSSLYSAQLAAKSGLPYAFAAFFAP